MSNTMSQFKETLSEINKIRNQEKLVMEKFEKSTCELSRCFHWILKAGLEGRNYCCLGIDTCPELYAEELKGMGFDVEEMRNDFNTLCGYRIKWKVCDSYDHDAGSEARQSARDFNTGNLQESINDKLAINQQREISSSIFAKQFISD